MTTRGIRGMAPVAAALLLCVLLASRVREQTPSRSAVGYLAGVASEIDAIPYRIGRYVGVDGEVTPGVIKLLKPNRILQRRYVDPDTGESFSLVFVHCGLAKDMTGHYPPNCYPRAGWVEAADMQTVSIEVEDTVIPASMYHFRLEQGIVPAEIDILSFFAVPSGPQRFGPDIRLVDLASRSPSASLLGAGQVQILTPRGMDAEQRDAIWSTVLETIYPALREIAEGAS